MVVRSGRSTPILVFALGLGAMFAILYAASQTAEPGRDRGDAIPTEPQISQIGAIEIIEQDLRSKVPELQETRLMFQLYNFSAHEYTAGGLNPYADYRHKLGFGWTFSHIKQNPEYLQLPLRFVHLNGTAYSIDENAKSFEKICDDHSAICPLNRFELEAADRLMYSAIVAWEPQTEGIWRNDGYYMIDAETGQIIWNSIDFELNKRPMPNVSFDDRTIRQLFEERLDPGGYMESYMEYGAHLEDNNIGYFPREIQVWLGSNNRVIWKNIDVVSHTVVSDTAYTSGHTGPFESSFIGPNDTYAYTFIEPGEYPYHCDIHPWMTGTVKVLDGFS